MKPLYPVALAAFAVVTLAQSQAPTNKIPDDCTAQNPCAVTTNWSTGQVTASHSLPPGTPLPPLPSPGSSGDSYNSARMRPGPEVLSLEETAVDYFRDVAMIDSHDPGNVLWDRGDELTDAEAAEVLEVARHAASVETQANADQWKTEHAQLCSELNTAGTAEALAAVFENSDARSVAHKKAAGKALLEQLSPEAREHLKPVLVRQREGTMVGGANWSRTLDVQPEALEMLRARMCSR